MPKKKSKNSKKVWRKLFQNDKVFEAIWDTIEPYVSNVGSQQRQLRKELRATLENLDLI